MPINRRGVFTPDFEADPQSPQWVNMGEDQPVDINPAVGAFQKRFMSGSAGDMHNVPTPVDMPMDMSGPDAGGGAAVKGKGLKSL